jgi:hypothetical protein
MKKSPITENSDLSCGVVEGALQHNVCLIFNCIVRANPMILDPHLHLLFFIRDADVDRGMWPNGHPKL